MSETAVVGFPHPVKGEAVFAFIVLKEELESSQENIVADLKKLVRSQIAGYAVPLMPSPTPAPHLWIRYTSLHPHAFVLSYLTDHLQSRPWD